MSCAVCNLGEPADWCWESRIDCPFRKPPRFLAPNDIWQYLIDFNERLNRLEEK